MSASPASPGPAPAGDFDTHRLRNALGAFPTGIVIATSWDDETGPLGMTMNSFASVSLQPPLILFSIDRGSAGLTAWLRTPGCAVNVLAAGQQYLSNQFARALTDKWQGVVYRRGLHGAPLLEGALASFECTLHDTVDGGDHVIFLARVERFTCAGEDIEPLVFHRGRYSALAPGTLDAQPALPSTWPLSIHY